MAHRGGLQRHERSDRRLSEERLDDRTGSPGGPWRFTIRHSRRPELQPVQRNERVAEPRAIANQTQIDDGTGDVVGLDVDASTKCRSAPCSGYVLAGVGVDYRRIELTQRCSWRVVCDPWWGFCEPGIPATFSSTGRRRRDSRGTRRRPGVSLVRRAVLVHRGALHPDGDTATDRIHSIRVGLRF